VKWIVVHASYFNFSPVCNLRELTHVGQNSPAWVNSSVVT